MEAESTFDRLIAAMPRNAEPVFMFLVAFNLLAMSGDIVIAHSYNEFALWGQYIPLGAGLVAGVVALYAAFSDAPGTRAAATTAMLVSVALGISRVRSCTASRFERSCTPHRSSRHWPIRALG